MLGERLQPVYVLVRLVQLRHGNVQIGLRRIDERPFLRLRQVRLRLGDLGLACISLGLVLSLVQSEEHLARFDHRAFR